MKKTVISTNKAAAAIGPYSQAIKINNLVFTSGQIPMKSDGSLLDGDIKEQTQLVLNNLKAVIEEAGTTLQNVVKCTCFLSDMNNFGAMNEVYAEFFDTKPPARSAVEVARLPKDVLIEIEAIALID